MDKPKLKYKKYRRTLLRDEATKAGMGLDEYIKKVDSNKSAYSSSTQRQVEAAKNAKR